MQKILILKLTYWRDSSMVSWNDSSRDSWIFFFGVAIKSHEGIPSRIHWRILAKIPKKFLQRFVNALYYGFVIDTSRRDFSSVYWRNILGVLKDFPKHSWRDSFSNFWSSPYPNRLGQGIFKGILGFFQVFQKEFPRSFLKEFVLLFLKEFLQEWQKRIFGDSWAVSRDISNEVYPEILQGISTYCFIFVSERIYSRIP